MIPVFLAMGREAEEVSEDELGIVVRVICYNLIFNSGAGRPYGDSWCVAADGLRCTVGPKLWGWVSLFGVSFYLLGLALPSAVVWDASKTRIGQRRVCPPVGPYVSSRPSLWTLNWTV